MASEGPTDPNNPTPGNPGAADDALNTGHAGGPAQAGASDASAEGSFSQADIDAALAAAAGEAGGAEEVTSSVEPAADASPKLDSAGRPFDEAAALMEAAIAEEKAAAAAQAAAQAAAAASSVAAYTMQAPPPPPLGALPLDLPDFGGAGLSPADVRGINLLSDVKLDVKIELGRADMYIQDVLKLNEGAVVELDKLAGDPVDILVNDRLVARGEVLVLNDNFCVRVSEIVSGAGEVSHATI